MGSLGLGLRGLLKGGKPGAHTLTGPPGFVRRAGRITGDPHTCTQSCPSQLGSAAAKGRPQTQPRIRA